MIIAFILDIWVHSTCNTSQQIICSNRFSCDVCGVATELPLMEDDILQSSCSWEDGIGFSLWSVARIEFLQLLLREVLQSHWVNLLW